MKTHTPTGRILLLTTAITILSLHLNAQLTNGGIQANFGVDADTKAGFVKYVPSLGLTSTDDWYGPTTGTGRGVIDTSNFATYKLALINKKNISFTKRMSVAMYTKVNSTLWLDGIYARDYTDKDTTSFAGGLKNGDDPSSWSSTTSAVSNKGDFLDVFAHMRRNGLTVNDSLWFFSSISTLGTSGARYYDVELYKNDLSHNRTTNTFASAGPDQGHTQWKFDATGKIIATGDMIIAVNSATSSTPVIEVRIWISYNTYNTVVPSLFKFGVYDGNSGPGGFGYASITSNSGGTAFGSGISNYTVLTITDTTNAGPWGTTASTGSWAANFQSEQFIEVGINLTRIGVDPGLYTALGSSACDEIFSSILFKSRSSSSFTSALVDFVAPIDFLNLAALNYSVKTDTISCSKTVGALKITNNSTSGYFSWKTIGGNISASNSDSTVVNITAPGKYILQASQKEGCPIQGKDTLVVVADTSKPISTAAVVSNSVGQPKLLGGDTTASNYATAFGGSKGLLWSWTGPNGFNSTAQNPLTNGDNGTYTLTVTEKRNGCTRSSSVNVFFSMLEVHSLHLSGSSFNNHVLLTWQNAGNDIDHYEIQRSVEGGNFKTIGEINGSLAASALSYKDGETLVTAEYRIKVITNSGSSYYSSVVKLSTGSSGTVYSLRTINNSLYLLAAADKNILATVRFYNMSGKLLSHKQVMIFKGANTIRMQAPAAETEKVIIVNVVAGNELLLVQKIIN